MSKKDVNIKASKEKIVVENVQISLGSHGRVTLTVEEAKELRDALLDIFPKGTKIEYVPFQPIDVPKKDEPWTWTPSIRWGTTTIDTSYYAKDEQNGKS